MSATRPARRICITELFRADSGVPGGAAPLEWRFVRRSVCKVPTFTARNGGRPINIHSNRSPLAITHLIKRSIGQAINCSEIGDHPLISAGQILQAVHFVENAASG